MNEPFYLALEPRRGDSDEGLRAKVADPLWFLCRQWQLGELQGEDASSPVAVRCAPRHVPIGYERERPDLDPTLIPAEALLEAEPGDWWTIGRRIRLGRTAAPLLAREARARLSMGPLPPPYDARADEVDGLAVFLDGALAGHPIWSEVPLPVPDRWSTARLDYAASFEADGSALRVQGHTGGDVEWFTVDGAPPAAPEAGAAPAPPSREVIPGHLGYPGAPRPRWWELEDHALDIGGFAPDRSHFPTLVLLDAVLAHADDWFTFVVPPPPDPERDPSSGVLVVLERVTVRDSFGEVWELAPPPVSGPGAWSLFHTRGLAESRLVIWPVAVAPLAGPALDEVLIGVDEEANLAWAVERRAEGRELPPTAEPSTAIAETARHDTRAFRYLPSTTLPSGWHPYTRVRSGDPGSNDVAGAGDGRSGRWRQGVVADLTGPEPRARPGPASRLIGGPSGEGLGRGHELDVGAIASRGLLLRRRAMLARACDGRALLWVERSASPLAGPPTSHLRFDVLAEDAAMSERR